MGGWQKIQFATNKATIDPGPSFELLDEVVAILKPRLTMHEHIEEGRALFKSRVTPDIYSLNLYDRAIVDVMIKSKGHVKSRIW